MRVFKLEKLNYDLRLCKAYDLILIASGCMYNLVLVDTAVKWYFRWIDDENSPVYSLELQLLTLWTSQSSQDGAASCQLS